MGSVDTELGRLEGTGSQRFYNISHSKGWGLSLDNPLGYVVGEKNDKLSFWKIALLGMWIMSCKSMFHVLMHLASQGVPLLICEVNHYAFNTLLKVTCSGKMPLAPADTGCVSIASWILLSVFRELFHVVSKDCFLHSFPAPSPRVNNLF